MLPEDDESQPPHNIVSFKCQFRHKHDHKEDLAWLDEAERSAVLALKDNKEAMYGKVDLP